MSTSSFTFQLPAGTAITKTVSVPTAGAWLGGVTVSFASNANVTSFTARALKMTTPTTSSSRTFINNITMLAATRKYEFLKSGETMIKVTYTCTDELSIGIETNTAAKVT